MPSILDQRIGVKKETTYGTTLAPERHYEGRSDDWQRAVERIDSGGFYQGRQGQRPDRDTQIDMGATGSIEKVILSAGEGLLLEDLLGGNVAPAAVSGATGLFEKVFMTTSDGPENSLSVEVVRSLGDVLQAFRYAGCIPTGFTFGVAQGDSAMMTITYDAQSEAKEAAPTAASYPSGAVPFDWTDAVVEVDGTQVDVYQEISIEGDLMMATDRYYLKGSALKSKPIRSGVPTVTGSITGVPIDTSDYDRFVSGETFPLALTFDNGGTAAAQRMFKLEMAAVKFTGSTPQGQLDGLTTVELPFTAFHDGSNPLLKITVRDADNAL